mmetsp:Transcript_35251/g.58922  ORF Transcript_35251/g.58922 Transcript_35251/m.58922 type:complete len:414 (-) Transcript_35251:547-1788(-)
MKTIGRDADDDEQLSQEDDPYYEEEEDLAWYEVMLERASKLRDKVHQGRRRILDKVASRRARVRAKKEKIKALIAEKRRALSEKLQSGTFVRFRDRVAYSLGVINLCLTEMILLKAPMYMHWWYTVWIFPLLALRYDNYKRHKWQYFLIDYCYIINGLLLLYLFFLRNSTALFKIIFSASNGPVALAIVFWRNSLVFHDTDKMTSVFIHAFPALVTFCLRWNPSPTFSFKACEDPCIFTWMDYMTSLGVYILWQLWYLSIVEVFHKEKLDSDPELLTSARWLLASPRAWLGKLCNRWGTKWRPVVYAMLQFTFTAVSSLPIPLLYQNFWAHVAFLVAIFGLCIWNGASFYFTVFAARYDKSLKQIENSLSADSDDECDGISDHDRSVRNGSANGKTICQCANQPSTLSKAHET